MSAATLKRPLAVAAAGTSLAALGLVAFEATRRLRAASPPYEVVARLGRGEIRAYGPRVLAVTEEAGGEKPRSRAFRRLALYLFGANDRDQELSMTTPVEMVEDEEKVEMSFYLPADRPDALPRPDDPGVRLVRAPSRIVAAIRWTGRSKGSVAAGFEAQLRQELSRAGWIPDGPAAIAQYDAPYVPPFLRRAEVLVPVRRPSVLGKSR